MSLSIYNQPRSIDFARNNLIARVKSNITASASADHYVLAEIVLEIASGGGTITLPQFRVYFNNSGIADIRDFGKVSLELFRKYYYMPAWSMSAPAVTSAPYITCTMALREMLNGELMDEISMGPWRLLNGRVNASEHSTFDLRQWSGARQKFLTNSPDNIYTYAGAKHFLYYLNPGAGDIAVRAFIEAGGMSYQSPIINLKDAELLVVPVSDLLASMEVSADMASVWIYKSDGSVLTNPKHYHFSTRELYSRSIVFQNRFGVFDTITGVNQSNKLSTQGTESIRDLLAGYASTDGDIVSKVTSQEDAFEFETGPITMLMAQHYKEVAGSDVVFLQTEDRWIRIIIQAASTSIFDEEKDLQVMKIKFRPAFSDDYIQHELELPEPSHEDYSNEYLKTDYQ